MMLQSQFWTARKVYAPCGMFTNGHLILLILSVVILTILIYISRNITKSQIKKTVRIFAIIITILESIKIIFNFYYGYKSINSWLPLSYCAIFIYSLWFSSYGKRKLKIMGDVFLAGASMVAGGAYLIFPSTALMVYPTWHYLSIYSMFFHTIMMYIGILYFYKMDIKLNKRGYKFYIRYYSFFALIAILLNRYCGSNLMMLKDPANIPFKVLHILHNTIPGAYTFLVFIVYLVVPYWFTASLKGFIKNRVIVKKREVKIY